MATDHVTVREHWQEKCVDRFYHTLILEQKDYLLKHTEIKAMLKIYMGKLLLQKPRRKLLKEIALYFTRPFEHLDQEIREFLNVPPCGLYNKEAKRANRFQVISANLANTIIEANSVKPLEQTTSEDETSTATSSFMSCLTSASTLPGPEPVPIPIHHTTLSEDMFQMVTNIFNKATFLRVKDKELKYDTAYVELIKIVERAMELPVIDIRKDIAHLLDAAYNMFEHIIKEKEKIAAEHLWENRMRKKMKRTMRSKKNFKGYEVITLPKNYILSRETYNKSQLRSCECYPRGTFNRYPKDRFGVYLPRETQFDDGNILVSVSQSDLYLLEEYCNTECEPLE